jgi:formate dehydrogenase maturation protein FdhE
MAVLWVRLKCSRCSKAKEQFVNKAQFERDKGKSYVCSNCQTDKEKAKHKKQIFGNGKIDDMFY